MENKPREIDVVAVISRGAGSAQFMLQTVIECKYSNAPWIAFLHETARDRFDPSRLAIGHRPASKAANSVLTHLAACPHVFHSELFRVPNSTAYGLVAMCKGTDRDLPYLALSQVTAASDAVVNRFDDG